MSVVVRIPAPLRVKADGQRQLRVEAHGLVALLDAMDAAYPGNTILFANFVLDQMPDLFQKVITCLVSCLTNYQLVPIKRNMTKYMFLRTHSGRGYMFS